MKSRSAGSPVPVSTTGSGCLWLLPGGGTMRPLLFLHQLAILEGLARPHTTSASSANKSPARNSL